MNWKRIISGGLIAGAVLFIFDAVIAVVLSGGASLGESLMLSLRTLPQNFLVGFALCWLYVLARPRLGPGPKTALIMGSVGFVLASSFLFNMIGHAGIGVVFKFVLFTWCRYVAATYLAGWQYIEKAP